LGRASVRFFRGDTRRRRQAAWFKRAEAGHRQITWDLTGITPKWGAPGLRKQVSPHRGASRLRGPRGGGACNNRAAADYIAAVGRERAANFLWLNCPEGIRFAWVGRTDIRSTGAGGDGGAQFALGRIRGEQTARSITYDAIGAIRMLAVDGDDGSKRTHIEAMGRRIS